MLEELVQAMPADLSDPEILADTLDYEIEIASQFVRDHVRFEPYLGVLKGPQGTAATLAGNAWDQAILLANLINTMGGEAQLVTGTLDSASAGLLLQRAFDAGKRHENVADTSILIPILARYNPEIASLLKKQQTLAASSGGLKVLNADTQRLADLLLGMVDMPDQSDSGPGSLHRLTDKLASSYAWVRWRDGPSEKWQALHPGFAEGQVPLATETGVLGSSIPEELQHRLTISMQIERHPGAGKIEREPIMDAYTRPTAQLFKQQLLIGMGPLPGPPGDKREAAFILPFLNGSLAPGARAVNALGITADAAAALQPGAGDLFARLSTTMGSAIGALNGADSMDGSTNNGPLLTGIVLQFKLQAPGFETHTVERHLADYRGGPAADFPGAFAFNSVVDINIGPETNTRVARQFIEQQSEVISAIPALMGVARGILPYEDARKLPEYRSLPEASWLDADIVSGALVHAEMNDTALFRPSAYVIARHTTTDGAGHPLTYSDVIFNPALALKRDSESIIHLDPKSVLEQGVRETLVESNIMKAKSGWSDRTPSSMIDTSDKLTSHIAKANWSTAAAEMAAQDIENGFKLLVTNTPEHWWRVDTKTGSTLGMGALGGQQVAEGIILIGSVAMSVYFFHEGVKSCDETYPDDQEMADCCIVANLSMTYVGAAAGGAANTVKATEHAGTLLANQWSSGAGYVLSALGFEAWGNVAADKISSIPLEAICRAYLDK